MQHTNQAVCLLLNATQHTANWIAVSRRNSTTQWGMPGGKVDPGETPVEALVREVKEEIGIDIDPSKLYLIYTGSCDNFTVMTYGYNYSMFSIVNNKIVVDPLLSNIKMEDDINIAFVDTEVLCNVETSPFAEYNKRVFDTLSKYQRNLT